jgi:hypothetical protein
VEVGAALIGFSTSISGLRQSVEHMVGELVVVSPSALMCCTVAACSLPGLTTVVSLNIATVAIEDEVVAAPVIVVDDEGVGEAMDATGEVGSP